jgi:molybdenum cofactor guanylyltransferase
VTSPRDGVALAGLVLCGGRGSRMGADKALVEIDGEPMVARAARRLASVADPVLLASGAVGRMAMLGLPYAEVGDPGGPGRGPLAGVVAGLEASPHLLMAVVAVDLPFLDPGLLAALARLRDDEDAVVPVTSAGPQPLHAVYATSALRALADRLSTGRLSMRAALGGLTTRLVDEAEWRAFDPTGRFAINVNEPRDLEGRSGS